MSKRKAIALFSGGLDSTLAMKLVIDQGIDVIACNINTGFGATKDRREHMQKMCDHVGAELRIVDIQTSTSRACFSTPSTATASTSTPASTAMRKCSRSPSVS